MQNDFDRELLVVAIDGPAGVGKSTVAQGVAEHFGLTLLDTGAIYRALAWLAQQQGVAWDQQADLAELAVDLPIRFEWRGGTNRVFLADAEITTAIRVPEISEGASQVSQYPQVRDALLQLQRDFGVRGAVVAEGRDIGTVVFPQASVKVFLEAQLDIRARRRHAQLEAQGKAVALDEVIAAEKKRDGRDSGRAAAPLRAAEGAVAIDTGALNAEQVVNQVIALCDAVLQRGRACHV